MKRLTILVITIFCMVLCVKAQVLRTEELETYAKEKYGEKWNDAAANLASTLQLDKNNSLTYVQVIDCPGKTKSQLYVILNYWVALSFNDASSVIKLNDKELGCIIIQGLISNIYNSLFATLNVKPIIKIDIKDNKIRVTYTVQYYEYEIISNSTNNSIVQSKTLDKWFLEKCYPFVENDLHKKLSSKALIMTHAFSNVIMDKIEEAVKNGVFGNENDNW